MVTARLTLELSGQRAPDDVRRAEYRPGRQRPATDAVAHILMGRDKRIYRFVQDTRFGRIVLAESHDVPVIVDAVTDYVARRMIEREHAMVATPIVEPVAPEKPRRSGFWTFVLGFLLGAAALFALALFASLRNL